MVVLQINFDGVRPIPAKGNPVILAGPDGVAALVFALEHMKPVPGDIHLLRHNIARPGYPLGGAVDWRTTSSCTCGRQRASAEVGGSMTKSTAI